jgi:hypothetical protein
MSTPPSSHSDPIEEKSSDHKIDIEDSKEKPDSLEDDKQYATGLTLNLIVLGLTLSVLLVALVIRLSQVYRELAKQSAGQCYIGYCYTDNYYCVQLPPGCWLVRKFVSHNHVSQTLEGYHCCLTVTLIPADVHCSPYQGSSTSISP